jgi:hypothetical protein
MPLPTPIVAALPPRVIDHWDLDDGDVGFPIYIPYIVPAEVSGIVKVTLSFHRMLFRSTTNVNPSSIGVDATAESGHSHSHSHSIPIDAGPFSNAAGWDGGNFKAGGGGTAPTNGNAVGSSGHNHSHTHNLIGGGAQSVNEASSLSNVTAIAFDGQDRTTELGGPWTGDVVEMIVTPYFRSQPGQWHTITLSLAGLARIASLFRVYYTA